MTEVAILRKSKLLCGWSHVQRREIGFEIRVGAESFVSHGVCLRGNFLRFEDHEEEYRSQGKRELQRFLIIFLGGYSIKNIFDSD